MVPVVFPSLTHKFPLASPLVKNSLFPTATRLFGTVASGMQAFVGVESAWIENESHPLSEIQMSG